MKPLLTFLAGAAAVSVGFYLGRARSTAPPISSVGPVWLLPDASRTPPGDSPLMRHISSVDFKRVPLEAAFDQLRDLGHLNIVVDWPALEGSGIAHEALVDLKLSDVPAAVALDRLLRIVGGPIHLGYTWQNDIVSVGVNDRPQVVSAVYDITDQIIALHSHAMRADRYFQIADLAGGSSAHAMVSDSLSRQECADGIVKWVEETIDPESWKDNGGVIGAARELGGYLFITQTPPNQEKIRAMLLVIQP